MNFTWLKRSMPRSLYGRAALILLLPIVLLQVAISVVFIQRHFEDVTDQLTRGVILDLALLRKTSDVEGLDDVLDLANALEIGWSRAEGPIPAEDSRLFYDVSGRTVITTLRGRLSGVRAVDLATSTRQVAIWIETRHGVVQARISRRRFSAPNPHQFLVLMTAIGLLMYAVSFVYLRNQLRPVTRLADAAEAFGKGHTMPYRPSGATEVRAAGLAFLDMRGRIERQIAQRTLLLSGVSHDLRTPLTRMKLDLGMRPASDGLEEIERDVDEMKELVDGFLDFARGGSQEEPTAIAPQEIAQAVVAKAKRLGGEVALAEMDGPVDEPKTLRRVAVERALGNLVSNAMRYAKRAEVSLAVTKGTIIFTVEDDGPGIPQDRREEATEPFTRLDAARNQNRGSGVGLGLSIAQDVARAHGGRLDLGEGSRLGGLAARLVLAR